MKDDKLQPLSEIFAQKNKQTVVKPPTFEWQDLALKLIQELNVPSFKKSSVFKICKENSKEKILRALNDTKELCKTGDKWKYFFKIVGS